MVGVTPVKSIAVNVRDPAPRAGKTPSAKLNKAMLESIIRRRITAPLFRVEDETPEVCEPRAGPIKGRLAAWDDGYMAKTQMA